MKSSPYAKKVVENALKQVDDFFSGKTPRKTPEQARADREAWKQKSMAEVKARNEKAKAQSLAADKADLPNLEKRHAELSAIYEKGKDWQYADREQNMTPEERKARDISDQLQRLGMRISAAKKDTSYAKGGKISLKGCKVSTAEKGKNKSHW